MGDRDMPRHEKKKPKKTAQKVTWPAPSAPSPEPSVIRRTKGKKEEA